MQACLEGEVGSDDHLRVHLLDSRVMSIQKKFLILTFARLSNKARIKLGAITHNEITNADANGNE